MPNARNANPRRHVVIPGQFAWVVVVQTVCVIGIVSPVFGQSDETSDAGPPVKEIGGDVERQEDDASPSAHQLAVARREQLEELLEEFENSDVYWERAASSASDVSPLGEDELYEQIGRLTMELELMKRKLLNSNDHTIFRTSDASVDFVSELLQDPVDPVQPVQPVQPLQPFDLPSPILAITSIGDLPAARQEEAAAVGAMDAILGSESQILNTADASDLLANSFSSTGVHLHSRNPVSNDVRIRGFHFSQIRGFANGAYYAPMRPDFDSPLSRIDSSLIEDVIIYKGPYTVRHVPGFSFIDIDMKDTPRGCGGLYGSGRTALVFDAQGEQLNARQTVEVGGDFQGLRLGYGHRVGSDYFRGDGGRVPASYNARDWDLAYGIDITDDSSLEFSYQRIDQTSVDLPAQYFFIDVMTGDALTAHYKVEDQAWFNQFHAYAWWNRSQMTGDPSSSFFDDNGNVSEIRSTGGRAFATWGESGTPQLTVGADYYLIDQESDETGFNDPIFAFGLPRSRQTDVGIYADTLLPIGCRMHLKAGGRVDWVNLDVIDSPPNNAVVIDGDERDYFLGSGFVSLEYELNCAWTATAAAGYAERAPSPTDLYARTFMALLQPTVFDFTGGIETNDFFFPGLGARDKERLMQFDLGVRFDYPSVRGGAQFYYAEIEDFITYLAFTGVVPMPGDLAFTLESDAQLAGGEVFGEWDLNDWLTAFGSVSYVEGVDQGIFNGQPLWSIPPLDSIVGIRISELAENPSWGLELAARMVASQTRNAIYVGEAPTPGFTTFDIRGYYRKNDVLSFVAGVENLLNRNYQTHLDSRTLFSGNPNVAPAVGTGVFRPGFNIYAGLIAEY